MVTTLLISLALTLAVRVFASSIFTFYVAAAVSCVSFVVAFVSMVIFPSLVAPSLGCFLAGFISMLAMLLLGLFEQK